MAQKIAYYECGGAYDCLPGEDPPESCPNDGCNEPLKDVSVVGDT